MLWRSAFGNAIDRAASRQPDFIDRALSRRRPSPRRRVSGRLPESVPSSTSERCGALRGAWHFAVTVAAIRQNAMRRVARRNARMWMMERIPVADLKHDGAGMDGVEKALGR